MIFGRFLSLLSPKFFIHVESSPEKFRIEIAKSLMLSQFFFEKPWVFDSQCCESLELLHSESQRVIFYLKIFLKKKMGFHSQCYESLELSKRDTLFF